VRVDRELEPCACEDRAGPARHRVVGHHTLEIGPPSFTSNLFPLLSDSSSRRSNRDSSEVPVAEVMVMCPTPRSARCALIGLMTAFCCRTKSSVPTNHGGWLVDRRCVASGRQPPKQADNYQPIDVLPKRGLFGAVRRRTLICWRSAKFSATRATVNRK